MSKKKDSLSNFDFLDDINDKYSQKENIIQNENQPKKGRGRPSGYFAKDFEKEPTKTISILQSTHVELYDLVYHISKIHMSQHKSKVTLIGVATKAILIGIEELKKEYDL